MNFFKRLFSKKEKDIVAAASVPEVKKEEPQPIAPAIVYGTPKTYENVNFVVLLDNGHAKSTAGKRSPLFDDGKTRFYEYEFTRDIVKRVAKKLDDLKIKYHVLVPEVNEDIALTTRANRANEYCKKYGAKNCMLISIHSNAYGDGAKWEDPGRWSVWTTVGVTTSDQYAKVFYEVAEEYLELYGFSCRNGVVQGGGNAGPDYESNFTVLYKTWCPAILTENLFYTNKKECEWLMTDTGREVIADIHVESIRRIVENL